MKLLKILRIAALFYLLLGEFADAGARDWPGWGGPDGNFAVNNAGVLHPDQSYALEVVWRKPLGTGYSGIAVRDGLAVALFSDGASDYVIGLDAGDGTQRWKHRIGPTFLGRYGSQSGPLSTPLLADGKVFALSPQGSLFALDAATGQRVWAVDIVAEHQALAPYWGFTSSPRKYGDLLFVQTGGPNGKAISAFDLKGKAVWSAVSDTVAYQSPGLFKLGDRNHLVFLGNHYLLGLVPETGEVLWEFAHGGQNSASAASGHPVEVGQGRYSSWPSPRPRVRFIKKARV